LLRNAIAAVAIIVIGIAILFGVVWYALEQFGRCRNVVLGSTKSPDGTKAVFVFRQECNATVPDTIWASVAPTDRPFVPDRNRAFLGMVRGIEVLPNWRGNDAVEISLIPGDGRITKHDEQLGNIRIDYK
jgi:hypothetical protein